MPTLDLSQQIAQLPLLLAFAVTTVGFVGIYFGLAAATLFLTRTFFPALRVGHRISDRAPRSGQLRAEIAGSIVSSLIFGVYGLLTVWLNRMGLVSVNWTVSFSAAPVEVLLLVVWNDLHFYLCHRLLHTRWLYKRVHIVHHRSVPPTPLATYSFHWLESLLLGSVMLLVMPFHTFNVLTLVLFPLVSLLLNNLGHMNYDLVPRSSSWHPLASSRRHSLHHERVAGNYGFLFPVFDWAFGTRLKDG